MDQVVSAAARFLLDWCCGQMEQYICNEEIHVEELDKEVCTLAALIRGLEEQGEPPARAVTKRWLHKAKALDGAAKEVLSDHKAMWLPRFNLWSRYNIGKSALSKIKKAKELIAEKATMQQGARETGLHVQEKQIETTVVGIKPYLDKALMCIDGDGDIGVIGICGMGGVGKTTLLRTIHGEFRPGMERTKEFDNVMWAVVYKKSTTDAVHVMENDVTRLQDEIAKQLGVVLDTSRQALEPELQQQRARPIHEYLSNRSFLLLLDDLWSPLDLKSIGVPSPTSKDGQRRKKKRKVVLTSRSDAVCTWMHVEPRGLISVDSLVEADAWTVFQLNATSQTIESHPAISNIAKDVMRECKGLPLALNTIGKAMSSKTGDPAPWKVALHKLQEAEHLEIPGMEKKNATMLHRLKISYDCLPSQRDKDCFLSCCLWPEDYSIDKAKLTECWLGLGLDIDNVDTCMSIITSLEQVHLLEPGDDKATQVKMHDTIRDMSLWISSDCGNMKSKWLVKAGVGMKTAQRVLEQLQEVSAHTERVSLMCNLIEELPSVIPLLPAAKTFMLQSNMSLKVIPASFLQSAPALTYLDLSNTGIREIPAEISSLHGLEYLNFSDSYMKKLPNELSYLTKLRCLLAATVWLTAIPYGIISKCKQLHTLDVFGCRYVTWTGTGGNGASIDEFEARGTFLKWLGITLGSVEDLKRLARCSNVRTGRLCFTKMPTPAVLHVQPSSLQKLLGRLDTFKSLQVLKADTCKSLREIRVSGSADSNSYMREFYCLPALEKLELSTMGNLEHIRFLGITASVFFPSLQSVTMANCSKIRNLNWTLHLPELSHLALHFCSAMEALIEEDEHPTNEIEEPQQDTFPVLKELTFHQMTTLKSLCRGRSVSFPALQLLGITQCPELTQLQGIRPQSKLREIRGGEKWWQRLQWEEPSLQKDLLPFFSSQAEH